MNIAELQQTLPYSHWKQMIINIKKSRRRKLRKQLGKSTKTKEHDEFDDPGFDTALAQVPSSELIEPNKSSKTSLSHRASYPISSLKLSNNPNAIKSAKMGEESGGQ